jgi:hypothetical protein
MLFPLQDGYTDEPAPEYATNEFTLGCANPEGVVTFFSYGSRLSLQIWDSKRREHVWRTTAHPQKVAMISEIRAKVVAAFEEVNRIARINGYEYLSDTEAKRFLACGRTELMRLANMGQLEKTYAGFSAWSLIKMRVARDTG